MAYFLQPYASPVGKLYLLASGEALCGVIFEDAWDRFSKSFQKVRREDNPITRAAADQLSQYFEGSRRHFDLPLSLIGTPFQKRAWQALLTIPYGTTVSYKTQAQKLSSPRGFRAVGRANGLNPLSIVIPCHRVISADGSLGGYSGGLKTKEFLLRLEGA